MDDNGVSIKKRKISPKYDKLSKEELLKKIEQLETTLEDLKSKTVSENAADEDQVKRKREIDFSKYKKRHIALKLLYLGWDYNGFVTQDNTTNTIEDHLFKALIKGRLIESRATSNYHRCGRTDQGVSSFAQVISLTVRSRLDDVSSEADELPYCKILNGLLPSTIRIVAWSSVPFDFSARFSCTKRTYKYWFPRGDLNIEIMNEAIQQVVGLHDFRNLCKMDVANGVVNFKREIYEAEVALCAQNSFLNDSAYDMCRITITGRGFLWHQIRCIVSVLFLVGQGKEDVNIIQRLLDIENCPRKPQYSLSNPLPLNLYSCEYDGIDWKIDQTSLDKVVATLQSFWTCERVKSCMLEQMLQDCTKLSVSQIPTNTYSILFKDTNSRVYKPLLSRPSAHSLEDRVSHYLKKGKLKLEMTAND